MLINKKRELLFSLTSKDFEFETYKGSGAGGQHRNKTESCVRCYHRPSGAMGQACEQREQHKNKVKAFERMANSKEFKLWNKIYSAKLMSDTTLLTVEEWVQAELSNPKNIKVEVFEKGKWIVLND